MKEFLHRGQKLFAGEGSFLWVWTKKGEGRPQAAFSRGDHRRVRGRVTQVRPGKMANRIAATKEAASVHTTVHIMTGG